MNEEILIPDTPKKMDEFVSFANASRGPGVLFAWVYGPDHRKTQRMAEVTWQDMLVKNPAQFARRLVSVTRRATALEKRE